MGDKGRQSLELGQLMEPWRKQVDSCIKQIQQNPVWKSISRGSSSLLAPVLQNGGHNLHLTLPLPKLPPRTDNKFPTFSHGSHTFACLSRHNTSSLYNTEGKQLFDVALSGADISQKLDGIPVYAVCNNASEFVLVSDSSNQKSLGFLCFRRPDAEALLEQVKAREPMAGKGAKVVAVSLNKVYKLRVEGISFRFLPDPEQVKNALQVIGGSEGKDRSFNGVPVFQSNNLIVRSKDARFCPIFFCKEDLDEALQRASTLHRQMNPSLKLTTDIQVGSFEHVLKQMEGLANDEGWGDVVFIPPGMTALGQLQKSDKTAVG